MIPLPRPRRNLFTLLSTLLLALLSGGAIAPHALAAILESHTPVTYNMQGAATGNQSKWTTDVLPLSNTHDIVALQEAGSAPPGAIVSQYTTNEGQVTETLWSVGTNASPSYRYVYFLQTDPNGNRVNLAIVTRTAADEVTTITPGIVGTSRGALGVRLGLMWFFTIHGLSGGGNDDAQLLRNIENAGLSGLFWTALGDFNRDPSALNVPSDAIIYHPGQSTQQSGGELDYMVSNDSVTCPPEDIEVKARVLGGLSSDHYPVDFPVSPCPAPENPRTAPLMLMSVGDSVVVGSLSEQPGSFSSSYRGDLQNDLSDDALNWDFVGSQSIGPLTDPYHEGYNSTYLDSLDQKATPSVERIQPNLITVLAGNEDVVEHYQLGTAPARMTTMIEDFFNADPGVTIIVGTILPPANSADISLVATLNSELAGVVEKEQQHSRHVLLADMGSVTSNDFFFPYATTAGYQKIADSFNNTILYAIDLGWLAHPIPCSSRNCGPSGGGGGGNPKRSIVPLRMMPIGDSITEGYETGPHNANGFRYPLQQDIQNQGQTIEFVGDQVDGTMTNPQNEGFSGQEIAFIAGKAVPAAASWRPNIATVLAGTNDLRLNDDIANAPSRLDSMISGLFSSAPDTTLLIAGIPHSSDGHLDALFQTFNTAVQSLVATRQNSGQHIAYVDMSNLDPTADKSDSLHPNDAGYKIMGDNFSAAVENVMNMGWVTAPVPNNRTTGGGGGGGGTVGTAKQPVGPQPGPGSMTNIGQIASGIGADPKTSFLQFADINGDGKADYLSINAIGAVTVYYSGGFKPDGTWNLFPVGTGLLASGIGDPGSTVRFADINGDGRADYVTVNATGLTRAYFNGGAKSDGSVNWVPAPYPNQVIATGIGAPGSSVHFGDINGDGFADYLAIDQNGAVTGYLNGGPSADGTHWVWYPIKGQIASGVGAPKGSLYEIADINNDGWGDYIVFDAVNGTVHAWVNGGIKPDGTWIWYPQGQIAPGNGAASKLHTPILADLDGDGKADYLSLNWGGSVSAWLNNGKDTSAVAGWLPLGSIANAATNLRWADIDGDGLADYITVDLTSGAAYAYLNGGRKADGSWIWYPQNQIAAGECGDIKTCYVEFGDLNGDKKADYLVGDYTSGLTSAWLSGGVNPNGGWLWYPQGTAQIGLTLKTGTVIQWVDLNNDGYADMTLTSPDGVTAALQNLGPGAGSWASGARLTPLVSSISQGPSLANGYAQNRFADINNDGRADLLSVLNDGSVAATINLGGSSSDWFTGVESVIAGGVGAPGSQIQFADLDGDGRADYLVNPPTGNVTAWLNNGGDNYKANY